MWDWLGELVSHFQQPLGFRGAVGCLYAAPHPTRVIVLSVVKIGFALLRKRLGGTESGKEWREFHLSSVATPACLRALLGRNVHPLNAETCG